MVTLDDYLDVWRTACLAFTWRRDQDMLTYIRKTWFDDPRIATLTIDRLTNALHSIERQRRNNVRVEPTSLVGAVKAQIPRHTQHPDHEPLTEEQKQLNRAGVAVCAWNIAEYQAGRRHDTDMLPEQIRTADDDFVEKWNPKGAQTPGETL